MPILTQKNTHTQVVLLPQAEDRDDPWEKVEQLRTLMRLAVLEKIKLEKRVECLEELLPPRLSRRYFKRWSENGAKWTCDKSGLLVTASKGAVCM